MTKREESQYFRKILFLSIFAIAMGYLESAVVVYLRQLYYPDGFSFPLREMARKMVIIELAREAATIIMLGAVSVLTARGFWTRFANFIFLFGIWDITYYLWLKITINWPSSLMESDILFLIPGPWVGPVLAPILISVLMVISGYMITRMGHHGIVFRPGIKEWIASLLGIIMILYTFLYDARAIYSGAIPDAYPIWMYIIGLCFCVYGFASSYRKSRKPRA